MPLLNWQISFSNHDSWVLVQRMSPKASDFDLVYTKLDLVLEADGVNSQAYWGIGVCFGNGSYPFLACY